MPGKIKKVVKAFYAQPWAMLPEKLDEVIAFIGLRAAGHAIGQETIQAAMQEQRGRIKSMQMQNSPQRQGEGQATVVIPIHGTISHRVNALSAFSGGTSTEMLGAQLREAAADKTIGRIVLDVDSPGGAVPGTHDLHQLIKAIGERKQIVTMYGGYGASAALWIGSAGSVRYAIPSALGLGSLGAIFIHRVKKDDGEYQTTVLRSVSEKARINDVEPLPESAKADMQAKLARIHEMFVADVASGLGLTVEHVNGKFGNGRTFMAQEAKAVGIIDEIATLDDVLNSPIRNPGTTSVTVAATLLENPMNPLIMAALVVANFVKASDSAEDFQAALSLWCQSKNLDVKTATDDQILASFKEQPQTLQPATKPGATDDNVVITSTLETTDGPFMSAQDLTALIQISNIPAEDRFTVLTEINAAIAEKKITGQSGVIDHIQSHATKNSTPAGFTMPRVTADESDKIVTQCVAAVITREYGEGSDECPETIIGGDGKDVKLADVQVSHQFRSVPRMIETMMTQGMGPNIMQQFDNTQLMIEAFFSNDLSSYGIRAGGESLHNTTGLFRNVLYNTNRVIARQEYGMGDVDYTKWCRRGQDLQNFDKVTFKGIGALSSPKAIGEDGEFSDMTFHGDDVQEGKLALWGGEYTYTWQMALADDLSLFTGVQRKMVAGLSNKEDNVAHQYLASNPNLKDGNPLFVDSINQLRFQGTTVFSREIVKRAKQKLYHQTDIGHDDARDGDHESLQFRPRNLVLPLAIEEDANEYFDSKSPNGATENEGRVNPHRNLIPPAQRIAVGMLDEEAGADSYSWYMLGDRNAEWISYHNLSGYGRPRVRIYEAREKLGVIIQIYKPFGVFAKGRRGVVKVKCNDATGVALS